VEFAQVSHDQPREASHEFTSSRDQSNITSTLNSTDTVAEGVLGCEIADSLSATWSAHATEYNVHNRACQVFPCHQSTDPNQPSLHLPSAIKPRGT
jgi:hypothetical protein